MSELITTNWIKGLIKEDIKDVQKRIIKDKGNLRGYLDSRLPFSFYLDIGDIRRLLLQRNMPFFEELAVEIGDFAVVDQCIQILDDAYVATINSFINGKDFEKINSEELSRRLTALAATANTPTFGKTLDSLFRGKSTIVITDASVINERVLLISPSFRTLSDRFGTRVKSFINYDALSDDIDDYGESPRSLFKKLLTNTASLQNIGHLQAEVTEGSRRVASGIVTPRLINALLEAPAEISPNRLAYKFSEETGQATTKITVDKNFNSAGVALQLLIEAGFLIGSLETGQANLAKAPLEAKFQFGKQIDKAIRENPDLLVRLVSSKTILQFIDEAILAKLTAKSIIPYKAVYNGKTSEKLRIPTLVTKIPKKVSKSKRPVLAGTVKQEIDTVDLISLQNLINKNLVHVISANMGSGDEKAILNYRTGRFAASAAVTNLTMSREGMITAFYTYMKNPYATFSEGGAQQYPKTRDPKLLISQSIREIAATRVANRLRAVAV